jgi:hypothetical protein
MAQPLDASRATVPMAGRCDDVAMSSSYEHIVSRGAHGVTINNVYERLVEADREIWFGSDGSGLIKTTQIWWSFFTDEQRTRWETTDHPPATESLKPVFDPFGPGGLSPKGPRLAKLRTDPAKLAADLEVTRELTLFGIAGLMGEALVPEQPRRALYEVAAGLPGAEVLEISTDELGRAGYGIARVEEMLLNRPGWRIELTFDRDSCELLGYRHVLLHDEPAFAPAGALVGWTSYLRREIVDALPAEAPAPVPRQ